jgi:predicted PurR-regulated permease PerM
MTAQPPSRDIPRITLAVLFIGAMIVASLWVLRPFIGATIWAATGVVATWPMMIGLQARLEGGAGLPSPSWRGRCCCS